MQEEVRSSIESIDILVVIDTEYVKAHNAKQPNPDWKKPKNIGQESQYMIANDKRGIISGQGTGNINFKANVKDLVGFTGVSIYGNSDDAVIIYGIERYDGDDVFNPFTLNTVVRNKAVYPDPKSPNRNGLPALKGPLNFNQLNSMVARPGTERFYVLFGLYTLDSDGQTQSLYGYFQWEPTITVTNAQ